VSVAQNFVFRTPTLRYNYQSLVSPPAVFDYDMTARKATLVKRDRGARRDSTSGELPIRACDGHGVRRHEDSDLARLAQDATRA
jgi:hypothetical protein